MGTDKWPNDLYFYGPLKFTKGENYLFNSEFAKSEGIYIWAIKDEKHNKISLSMLVKHHHLLQDKKYICCTS